MRLSGFAKACCFLLGSTALGCSDPVPTPAQGAVQYSVFDSSNPPPGKACVGRHNAQISTGQPPSPTEPGGRVTDGEGAKVACAVTVAGDKYAISGKLIYGSTSFTISGNVAPGGTGEGRVTTFSPGYVNALNSDPAQPCVISVENTATSHFEVAGGRIWAQYTCPAITDPTQPSFFCAGSGVFVMEECDE